MLQFRCRSGFGVIAAAVAAAVFGSGPPVQAQTIYDGGALDSTDKADLAAWSVLFWQRVDQGGGSPGDGFAFTKTELNGQLFNPLRAARPTLEKVGLVKSGDCDQLGSDLAMDNPQVADTWKAFKDLMIEGKIATDWTSDPDGAIQHANLILAAPADAGLTVYLDGTKLVSQNLPLEKVSQAAYDATVKLGVSEQTQTVIAAIIGSGAAWSAWSGDVTDSRKLVTGESSKADNFANQLRQVAVAMGSNPMVWGMSAQFGVYGALPFVVVQFEDATVLVDVTNGNLVGPLENGSALDARPLLSQHSEAYAAGSAVAYFSQEGCPQSTMPVAIVYPGPTVPGTVPGTFTPVVPGNPALPIGRPTTWTCVSTGSPPSGCSCTTSYSYTAGPPCPASIAGPNNPLCILHLTITCTSTVPCSGGGPPNTTPAPAVPAPPATPTPSPTPPVGTGGCTESWWYN